LTNANDFSLAWSLRGPRGNEATNSAFRSDGNAAMSLPAGHYVMTVNWSGGNTGPYSFRMLDLAAAPAIASGSIQNGTLNPGNSRALYRFDAQAGDTIYFDMKSVTGGTPSWLLYDPYGKQVWGINTPTTNIPTAGDKETTGIAATGTYALSVVGLNDQTLPVSYSFAVYVSHPATPVRVTASTTQPGPDLVPTEIGVSAAGPIESGGLVTVTWKDANVGTLATTGSWVDGVVVRNTANEVLVTASLPYDRSAAGNGDIGVGQARQRQVSLRLPDGARATGNLTFSVTTDTANALVESNSAGTAESNNSSNLVVLSSLAAAPDLQVQGISVDPPVGWKAGDPVNVSWTTYNSGNKAAAGVWKDQIRIRDELNGTIAFVTDVPYDSAINGVIGAGTGVARQYQLTWPSNLAAAGLYTFEVVADASDQLIEANADGTAETNNLGSLAVASAPDFSVIGLRVTSTTIAAGELITLAWSDVNHGTISTYAGWWDNIAIYNRNWGQVLYTSVFYDPSLPGNSPLARCRLTSTAISASGCWSTPAPRCSSPTHVSTTPSRRRSPSRPPRPIWRSRRFPRPPPRAPATPSISPGAYAMLATPPPASAPGPTA
jgi:hypothetical protein